MGTSQLELPETILTGPAAGLSVPNWMAPLAPRVTKPKDFEKVDQLPGLTIVWFAALQPLLRQRTFLTWLSRGVARSRRSSRVVFVFESEEKRTEPGMEVAARFLPLLNYFEQPADLEIAFGSDEAKTTVWEAVAKYTVLRNQLVHTGESDDPLSQVKEILAATKDLRAKSGRLAADKVAAAFDLSVAELSGLVGRTRQAISKTPDADSLQPLLRPFERAARLRAELDAEQFRSWLYLTNWQLQGRTPLDLIREGKVGVVADLAEDLLTGQPA